MEPNTTASSDVPIPEELATVHPLFSDSSADITFQSCDGVLFKIHSKHLASTSSGFALPSESTHIGEEPVVLEEPAAVLELLFQFIHPPTEVQNFRQPSVRHISDMKLFFNLAEAAEKYTVFAVASICEIYMHHIYKFYPIEVLNHALYHGYDSLADKAALFTLSKPKGDIAKGLTCPGSASRWIKYYGLWTEIPIFVSRLLLTEWPNCKRLREAVGSLHRSATVDAKMCSSIVIDMSLPCQYLQCPCLSITQWQSQIDQKVQAIPLFSHVKI